MPRPCQCDRLPPAGEPYSAAYCRLCWLYHNDPGYRLAWDRPSPPPRDPGKPRIPKGEKFD